MAEHLSAAGYRRLLSSLDPAVERALREGAWCDPGRGRVDEVPPADVTRSTTLTGVACISVTFSPETVVKSGDVLHVVVDPDEDTATVTVERRS